MTDDDRFGFPVRATEILAENDVAGGPQLKPKERTRHDLPSIRDGRPCPTDQEYDAANDPFLLPSG